MTLLVSYVSTHTRRKSRNIFENLNLLETANCDLYGSGTYFLVTILQIISVGLVFFTTLIAVEASTPLVERLWPLYRTWSSRCTWTNSKISTQWPITPHIHFSPHETFQFVHTGILVVMYPPYSVKIAHCSHILR